MPFRRRAVVASLAWALPAVAAAASPQYAFFRPSIDPVKEFADEGLCREKASHQPVPSQVVVVPAGGGLAGGIAAGIAMAILQAQAEHRVVETYTGRCMRSQGYVRLTLTPQEVAARHALKGDDEKKAWLVSFYGQDLSARVAAAAHPAVPPFSDLPPAPFAVGGLQLDPATLHVADGPVKRDAPLLTATGVHRRTGRLTTAYSIPGTWRVEFAAGAVVHQIPNPNPDLDMASLWCGEASAYGLVGHRDSTWCLAAAPTGYELHDANGGQPWLAGGAGVPAKAAKSQLLTPFPLEESDKDLIGPLPVEFRVGDTDREGVELQAFAVKDGKKVLFWSDRFHFDDQGRAVIPLWTHRLVLTRADKALTPVLTADGDGAGLEGPEG